MMSTSGCDARRRSVEQNPFASQPVKAGDSTTVGCNSGNGSGSERMPRINNGPESGDEARLNPFAKGSKSKSRCGGGGAPDPSGGDSSPSGKGGASGCGGSDGPSPNGQKPDKSSKKGDKDKKKSDEDPFKRLERLRAEHRKIKGTNSQREQQLLNEIEKLQELIRKSVV